MIRIECHARERRVLNVSKLTLEAKNIAQQCVREKAPRLLTKHPSTGRDVSTRDFSAG
jgi:hypothetical protein